MKKLIQLILALFIFFWFIETGISQNAYYDSYKIMRILDLKKVIEQIESAKYEGLDINNINEIISSFDEYGNLKEGDYNLIVLKVNDVYSKIFGFLNLPISKIDEKIKFINDGLNLQQENLKKIQDSYNIISDSIKKEIGKLNENVNTALSCDSTIDTININTLDDVITKTQLTKWEKIISSNCSSETLRNFLESVSLNFKKYDSLKNEMNSLQTSISNSKNDISILKNQIELRKELISKDYLTDIEKLKDLTSKKTEGLTVEASKTVSLDVKNEMLTDQQSFNISEAALIQAFSDVIISSFKQNVISFAIDKLIDEKDETTQIILKNTIRYIKDLKQSHDISLPVILQKVKTNIYQDFDALPDNLLNDKILSRFNISEDRKLVLKSLLSFSKILKDKKHPVEVLNIAQENLKRGVFNESKDFQKYLLMTLILQKNLRDLSPNSENVQVWITSDKIIEMLKNPVWTNLFFESLTSRLDEYEKILNLDVEFEKLKKEASGVKQIVDESKSLLFSYVLKLNKFEKTIDALSKKIDDESIVLFFDSFKELLSTFQQIELKCKTAPGPNSNKYLTLVESSVDIIKCISGKDYIHLIQALSYIANLDTRTGSKLIIVTESVSEKIALVDGIMNSKTGEELESAITNVVTKNGGYAGKIENSWSLSVNSYLGLFFGGEYIGNVTPFSMNLSGGDKAVNFGISVPIGLNISYTPENWPTFNFLLQIFDFTAPINYRFSDTSALPSEIKFKQLISPGLLLMVNPSKEYPIGIGLGIQYMPELRKINESPQENKSVKYGFFMSYDLPLFYLYKPD